MQMFVYYLSITYVTILFDNKQSCKCTMENPNIMFNVVGVVSWIRFRKI